MVGMGGPMGVKVCVWDVEARATRGRAAFLGGWNCVRDGRASKKCFCRCEGGGGERTHAESQICRFDDGRLVANQSSSRWPSSVLASSFGEGAVPLL